MSKRERLKRLERMVEALVNSSQAKIANIRKEIAKLRKEVEDEEK